MLFFDQKRVLNYDFHSQICYNFLKINIKGSFVHEYLITILVNAMFYLLFAVG